jgi:hypothetical protein
MNTEDRKAARVAQEFPKRCGCCPRVRADVGEWSHLALAANVRAPDGRFTDVFATFEMRNCDCGTTLVIVVEVHDLDAE